MDSRVADNGTDVLHADIDFNIKGETQEFVMPSGRHIPEENRHLLSLHIHTARVMYGYGSNSMRTSCHKLTPHHNPPSLWQTPPSGDASMVSVCSDHGHSAEISGGVK